MAADGRALKLSVGSWACSALVGKPLPAAPRVRMPELQLVTCHVPNTAPRLGTQQALGEGPVVVKEVAG